MADEIPPLISLRFPYVIPSLIPLEISPRNLPKVALENNSFRNFGKNFPGILTRLSQKFPAGLSTETVLGIPAKFPAQFPAVFLE